MSSSKIEESVRRSYGSKPKYTEIMPGVPEDYKQIGTLGDLLKINYKHVTVEEQLRGNLVAKLRAGEHPYPASLAMTTTSCLQSTAPSCQDTTSCSSAR